MPDNKKSNAWNTEQIALSRAKREASSAPRKKDLAGYGKYLKRSISRKKNSRVLILGATPELRDLSLDLDCETIAVDMNEKMFAAMNAVMRHKKSSKNKTILGDWLELDKLFKDNYFDAVLGDASINNIPPEKHKKIFDVLSKILKPGGGLIIRQIVLQRDFEKKSLKSIQEAYDRGEMNWMEFYWGFLVKYHRSAKVRPHEFSLEKIVEIFQNKLEKHRIKLKEEDRQKVFNCIEHTRKMVHVEFLGEEFDKIASEHFKPLAKHFPINKEIRWVYVGFYKNEK